MKITQWDKAEFDPKEVKINILIDDEHSKEIQILLAKDSVMKEHKAPFAIRVQVLSGKIWFEVQEQRFVERFGYDKFRGKCVSFFRRIRGFNNKA